MSVFLFIFVLMIMVNISMDLAIGMSLTNAFSNLANPFWVMEKGEFVIVVFLIAIMVAQQIFFFIKKSN